MTERLGLRNIAFEEISIEDYAPDDDFDYVIAHGVYSWVPEHVRERLLALCASVLSPAGVAYVSYNALPGGHPRQALREMLTYHVAGIEQPAEQMAAARGFLRLLSAAGEADSELAKTLGPEARKLFEHVDALFFHDTLAENNQPLYFHEFVAQAGAHGLQFLSEAEFSEMQLGALPEQLRQALLTISDPLRREQYLDFLKERMFRQTLLVRSEIALDRTPRPQRLAALAVSAPLRWATDEKTGRVTFTGTGGAHLTTDHPLVIATLQRVGDAWPSAPWISQLGTEAELRGDLRRAAALLRGEPRAPARPPAGGEHRCAGAPAGQPARAPGGGPGRAADDRAPHRHPARRRPRPAARGAARRHARPRGAGRRAGAGQRDGARRARRRARAQPRSGSRARGCCCPTAPRSGGGLRGGAIGLRGLAADRVKDDHVRLL